MYLFTVRTGSSLLNCGELSPFGEWNEIIKPFCRYIRCWLLSCTPSTFPAQKLRRRQGIYVYHVAGYHMRVPTWCRVPTVMCAHFVTANMIKGVQNSAKSTCFISFSHDLPCHLLSLTAWLPSCQRVHKQNILLVWYAIITRAILAKYGNDNDNDNGTSYQPLMTWLGANVAGRPRS